MFVSCYLVLCRTFSPHRQKCITQGEGKDQFLPFFNVPFCRLRWYLEGRSSGRDVFTICCQWWLWVYPWPADCHQQFDPSSACPTCVLHPTSVSVAAWWPSWGGGLSPSTVPALPFAAGVASESPGSEAGALPQGRCAGCVWDGVSSWASVPAAEMGTASPVPAAHLTCSGHLQALPTQFSPSSW